MIYLTDFFTNSKICSSFFKKLCIIFFWIIIWEFLSRLTDNSILMVGPADTLKALFLLLPEPDFWISIFRTLLRTMGGFIAAAISAICFALLSYRIRLIEDILSPLISLIKAIPVASFVILVLIWLRGNSLLSFVIAYLVVFPAAYINILNGLKSTDIQLLELAEVYHIGFGAMLHYIYMPAIKPFLLSSLQTTLGMSWKSGIAAELIGQPEHTIGYYLYQSRIFLDTAGLFAWTAVIILLSYSMERLCTKLIKHYYKSNEDQQ